MQAFATIFYRYINKNSFPVNELERFGDFRGGKVGLVRKVLKAGILQNSRIEKDLGAICPAKVRDWGGFRVLCPAKVRFAKRFLGKRIRQECPAKIRFWSFDSADRSKKVGWNESFWRRIL